jgi:hypothetical protein
MNLEQINLYCITHINNIPHILQNGITHRNSPNTNPNFVDIGDLSLIDTRSAKYVRIDNGDFDNKNCSEILLGDFIPFYFGVRMPMMYVIQNGGNFVKDATPAQDIIYLVYPLSAIIHTDNEFYFSDGHATDNLTTFYNKNRIEDLPVLIDWDAVKAPFWGGQNNLNIKRKKQAEFLVKNDLKYQYIKGIVCYNQTAKQNLLNMNVEEEKIKIFPQAYY